jgi:sugar phosphate isomerase/epimerase
MKFSVCSACLPELPPEEVLSVLPDFYAGIEWRIADISGLDRSKKPHHVTNNHCTIAPNLRAAAEIREACGTKGVKIIGVSPYIEVGDCAAAESSIALAQEAGAQFVRMRGALMNGDSYRTLHDRTVAFFKEISPAAARAGIRIFIEMHQGTICPSASLAHRIVSRLDPEIVGVIFDAGNLTAEGFEDYRIGFELLGPRLAHVHLKNGAYRRPDGGGLWSRMWTSIDDGMVDVPLFLRRLKEFSYKGWISIEDFSAARDNRAMLSYNAAYLSQVMSSSN